MNCIYVLFQWFVVRGVCRWRWRFIVLNTIVIHFILLHDFAYKNIQVVILEEWTNTILFLSMLLISFQIWRVYTMSMKIHRCFLWVFMLFEWWMTIKRLKISSRSSIGWKTLKKCINRLTNHRIIEWWIQKESKHPKFDMERYSKSRRMIE